MSNTPKTYSEASKVAEEISLDEFVAFVAADDNLDVYPAPRKARRIAMGSWVTAWDVFPGRGFFAFEYCNRTGYTCEGGVSVGYRFERPIFHSDRLDRTVIVEPGY